jgi:hypothetical protein
MSKVLFDLVTQHGICCPTQFAGWLYRLLMTTNAHGRQFIATLPNTMTAADGDRILEGAVEAEWIIRAGFEPNGNQVAIGAGGMQGPDLVRTQRAAVKVPGPGWDSYAPASWFNFAPGPKAAEALAWCGSRVG